ncbi:hypothetical protein MCEGE10_01691 [Flavobacteriaceae bacterium]
MKNIKIYSLVALLFAGFTFVSCDDSTDVLTGDAALGGELMVKKDLIGYVVGNGLTTNYDNEISIFQGTEKVVSIDVYKTFTTKDINGDAVVSNKILLKTIPAPAAAQHEVISFGVNYNDLASGLSVGGTPLPVNDGGLLIGDYWTLTYVSHLNNGQTHATTSATKIAVGTRFSGKYRCVDALYFRLGALTYTTANWPAETTIEAVDATTYKVVNYLGAAVFTGNTWYFTIVNDVIDIPVLYNGTPQLGNGQPFISCASNPVDMAPVNCGSSNVVIRDDVTGKDRLKMSYGYYTGSGAVGPRVFYQEMEKIVE